MFKDPIEPDGRNAFSLLVVGIFVSYEVAVKVFVLSP